MQVSYPTPSSPVDLDNVVTLAELKTYLRVDNTVEDALITSLRAAAVGYIEEYVNGKIGISVAVGSLDYFVNSVFPVGPVTGISSVTYLDVSGDPQTLSSNRYYYDATSEPARIAFHDVPSLETYALARVTIGFNVGYSIDAVPDPIVTALRMLVAHYYENRRAVTSGAAIPRTVPLGVESLLAPYRVIRVV